MTTNDKLGNIPYPQIWVFLLSDGKIQGYRMTKINIKGMMVDDEYKTC
ncbi:hypothetical protein [Calothrix sp. 336/3]|nr:hypothetical protein [Calothrix sp. 336/3]